METRPRRSYLVCGTPRSGTSLLCEGLKATGIAGRPEEYFWRGNEPYWRERWGVEAYAEYMAAALREGTTPNGVFGAKVMWTYFPDDLVPKLRRLHNAPELPAPELLAHTFPYLRYVFIRRADRIRQAVSWEKATQTGIWTSRGADAEPQREPAFDFDAIDRLVSLIGECERGWRRYFVEAGVAPVEVVYEELVRGYEGTIRRALDDLGIPIPPELVLSPPRLRKQADALSEVWVARYVSQASRSLPS